MAKNKPPSIPIFIDPTSDFGFKKLFGEEANKDLLIDFLNSMLPAHHQIAELNFEKNDHQFDSPEDRRVIFDIYCKAVTGEYFIIEMQKSPQEHIIDRSIFYVSTSVTKQGVKGSEWQYNLKTVYFIGILNFEYDEDIFFWKKRKLLRNFALRDEQGVVVSERLQFKFLQLPFFKKKPHQLRTRFDKWCYFLQNLESLDHIPKILNEPIFMKALSAAQIEKMSPLQYTAYLMSRNAKMDYELAMDYAKKKAAEKGWTEGLEEGIEKGMEKGMELSIEKLLIKNKLTVEEIAETIEVPIEYVLKIKERLAES
ncbi:MAG: PD-(D/E)XK nuclease family transposase [Saprospiraceae bacterium]|nr:PD-(D/E)XK nuclease family transposase [Saprospiraceae bacterium]